MAPLQALRQSLGALIGAPQLRPREIQDRVRGRYPEAAALPGRSGLNDYSYYFNDYPSFASVLQEQLGDASSTLGGLYSGYDGPCPPWNDERPHRYVFTVHALSVPRLDIPDDATAALAGFMVNAHTLAKASFTATYGRP